MPAAALTHDYTRRIIHSIARVCSEGIGADNYVFAVAEREGTEDLEPMIVDLADDFTEAGFPFVTLALGPWTTAYGGEERLTFNLLGTIWAERFPLDVNTLVLYSARDAIADAFIAHSKAFPTAAHPEIQSAVLMGGPGVRARSVPRAAQAEGAGERVLLTLPFNVQVKANRPVQPQPA